MQPPKRRLTSKTPERSVKLAKVLKFDQKTPRKALVKSTTTPSKNISTGQTTGNAKIKAIQNAAYTTEVENWAKGFLKIFPQFVFYFVDLPKDEEKSLSDKIAKLGAVSPPPPLALIRKRIESYDFF